MTEITKDELAAIRNALDGMGVYDYSLRRRYSGRGMYGRECFGIVAKPGDITLVALAFAAAFEDAYRAADYFADVRTDNMGYDTIIYFPDVTVEGDDADDDE